MLYTMYKLFFCVVFLLLVSTIFGSPIYKCGQVYSSKPCEGKENAEISLPNISVSGKSAYDKNGTGSVLDDAVHSPLDRNNNNTGCVPIGIGGYDLAFQGISLTRTLGEERVHTTISGSLRNRSNKLFQGPVNVRISPSQGPSQILFVGDDFMPTENISFTHILKTTSNGSTNLHSQSIKLELIYSPASRCDSVVVSGLSAQIDDQRKASNKNLKKSLEEEAHFIEGVSQNLSILEQEIDQNEKQYRNSSRGDTAPESAKTHLSGQLIRYCNRLLYNNDSSVKKSVAEDTCRKLGQKIARIGYN